MTAQDFNKEMGHYLKARGAFRRSNPFLAARNFFKGLGPQKKKEELPLDIPPEQVQAVIKQSAVTQRPLGRPMTRPTAKPLTQAAAKPEATKKQQKVGIMKWFNKKEEDYEVVEQAPVLDEDVKEVLKITFKWLKQMDPELIEDIKASEDFEKYKKLLDKYGLIKK